MLYASECYCMRSVLTKWFRCESVSLDSRGLKKLEWPVAWGVAECFSGECNRPVFMCVCRRASSGNLKVAGLTLLGCLLLAGQAVSTYVLLNQRQHLTDLQEGTNTLRRELSQRTSGQHTHTHTHTNTDTTIHTRSAHTGEDGVGQIRRGPVRLGEGRQIKRSHWSVLPVIQLCSWISHEMEDGWDSHSRLSSPVPFPSGLEGTPICAATSGTVHCERSLGKSESALKSQKNLKHYY